MKKRLMGFTLIIVLVSLLISNAAGVWFLFNQQREDARQNLRELLILMDSQSQTTDAQGAAEQFRQAAPDKRLTIITPEGEVLVDTKAEGEQMGGHADRPEVITAKATGWGEDTRASDTVGVPMLYVAKRFTDGMIGRASMPLSSIDTLVWRSMTGFLVASVAALLLALALSSRMARRVLEPLEAVSGALTGVLSGASTTVLDAYRGDDELRPILRYIDKLVERLGASIQHLTEERDKVNLILDCMDEGFLLLDEKGGLLASNRAARELFGAPEDGGEAAGPESVREALEIGAKRIGHGVHALGDNALLALLAEKQIPLEMCPTSNLHTKAVKSLAEYPVREFLRRGVRATINTDNPGISRTTVENEFAALTREAGLTASETRALLHNAAGAAFLPP